MPSVNVYVAETVVAFTLLVCGTYLLKRKGVLRQEDASLFSRLLTQAVLPATIFYQLWTHRLSSSSLIPVMVIFLVGAASLAISWLIGTLLGFDLPSTGALMIVSSFGSSALIGYPIIQYVFANDPSVLAHGIVISELGVGLPIFIFCPAVAMFFGGTFKGGQDLRRLAKEYFLSPIFIAVVAGLALSRLSLPAETPLIATLLEALKMVQGALVVVSAIILGLQLSFQPLRGFWKLIVISIVVQMVFQPWFCGQLAGMLHVGSQDRQVLVLVTAMPAAILGPVFASRYNCAARTATMLTFTHIVISPVLVPAIFSLLT
jgi:predicted permease